MDQSRPPYGAAALSGLALFAVYFVTLAPTTAFWDTSEYIATAHILGIPHPPGNPLFLILARAWSVLLAPLGLSVPVRINLLAAVTSAASSAFLFLVAYRVLMPILEHRWRALVGAGVAALVGGTAFTVWNQSNANEKVYTLSVLIIAAVTWLAVRWRDRRNEPGSDRYLLWAGFLMVLGSTNHLMSVLPAPALGLFVLLTDPRVLFRPRFLVRAVPLVLLGLSVNLVVPIRAAQDPVINEGDATCESIVDAATAIYSNGRAGCPALSYNLLRRQYQKPPVTQRMSPLSAQFENYFQYFDWQWARGLHPSELPGTSRLPFTLLFLALGGAGLWAAWKADRAVFAYLAVLELTLTAGLVYYLNFKYGFSLAPDLADAALHEVRERDYFFVAGFLVWGALAGIGIAWTWGVATSLAARPWGWALTSPVLLLAAVPLFLNWSWASRAGDYAARDWAYDLLMSVEPYGVLFTNGDNDTFPLWYMQEVEGVRKDVTVIVGQYLFTDWYPKQLQELSSPERQRPFDPTPAPDLYDPPAAPRRSITALSHDQMDQIGGVLLPENLTIPFPGIAVTYPAGTELNRGHQLALNIIHDSIDERPVYFASTGGLMSELGLDRWAVRHGLVTKLVLRSPSAPLPEGAVQGTDPYGGEIFEAERSLELYLDVYQFRSLRDRAIWQDRSTVNIPLHFYALALQLSDIARESGRDADLVGRLEEDAIAFQRVAEGGSRIATGG